ncbi:hypothetical protein ACIRBX_33510 [Kitasatospora sp. NPDC096147]|uniref:SCO2583/SCO2584 N-terminal domain-containing protein n=1 Tax=Kitasatospora sp. NPDC096147 TaxID=3364093 RepID=UPI00382DA001
MPTSDDHTPRRPDDSDPFDGLVLDEDFVKGATSQEGSARSRRLAAEWQDRAPVDPGGRTWSPADPVSAKASRWLDRHGRLALTVLCCCGIVLSAVAYFVSARRLPAPAPHSHPFPLPPNRD